MYTGTMIERLIEDVYTAERSISPAAKKSVQREEQTMSLLMALSDEFQRHESFFEVA
jgi:hypothetical protein